MIERKFNRVGGDINERVRHVIFRNVGGRRWDGFTVDRNNRVSAGAPWSLKNALSLVETGHWIETTVNDVPESPCELEGDAW